jgi:acyl-coenzyme A synthetase/AMP-(fatty) acid ligase/acyl carrier protein
MVVMPPGLPSLTALRKAVLGHGVSVLSLPAGLFGLLVDNEPEALAALRVILISGDFADPDKLERAAALTTATVYNGYGCTENSSITALYPITEPADVTGPRVPIGKPLPGVALHVLDEDLRPCLPGETGELCVGGAGVAAGYLGLPELTREKFVTVEGEDGRAAVLYRTGDLARRTDEGDVVLVGRADSMVKVRGFRVETAEVELALRGLDEVDQGAVKSFEGTGGGARHLVGYYTTADGHELDPGTVASRLGEQIPGYAVPETLVQLDQIPVNVNGKIDRAALADPSARAAAEEESMSDQANPLEPVILQMWKDISGNKDFTATDPFLGHGGNSLHFVQLATNLQKVFAIDIDTEDVFRHGTVEQLAAHVDKVRSQAAAR